MFTRLDRAMILALLGALVMVACNSQTTAPTSTFGSEQAAGDAVSPARAALAEFLDVDEDAIELEKIEDAEWLDSCLGLGGPTESCLQAVTPGYAITSTFDGVSYVVRTDLKGDEVRLESSRQ